MRNLWGTLTGCLVLSTMLGGCATSPAVRFFGLTPIESDGGLADGPVIVGIGPLSVAPYLHRPQIVTRSRAPRMKVDDFNRWAEPLEESLPRVLTLNVAQLLQQAAVIQLPAVSALRPAYRVIGDIGRFDVDQSGLAVLEVQWSVDNLDRLLLGPYRRRFTRQAERPGDTGSEVTALNAVVEAFSRDVADRLAPLVAEASASAN